MCPVCRVKITFLGLQILNSALRTVSESGRYFHFRPATKIECVSGATIAETTLKDKHGMHYALIINGKMRPLKDGNGNELQFHFFETYGYRFTLLLNIANAQGKLEHLERIENAQSTERAIEAVLIKNLLGS